MGADISIPLQRLPNRSEIQDKTETTIFLMNRILDFILRNADIADIVSLATDEGCKKYIIIAESKLSVLFNKIRIQPELGTDGTLYLKKVTDLEKESKQGGLNKLYCEMLSFFFIRLFQIVGALALSVIDTSIPLQDYLQEQKAVSYERKGIPFFKQEEEKKKGLFGRIFRGGALTGENIILGKYKFLNNYLTFINTNKYQLNSFAKAERGGNELKPGVFISIDDNDKFKVNYNDGANNISFNFEINDAEDIINISNIILNEIKISITNPNNTFAINLEKKGRATVGSESKDFADYIMSRIDIIKKSPKSQTINLLKSLNYLIDYKDLWYKIKDTNIFIEKSREKDDNPLFLFKKESKVKGKDIEFKFIITITNDNNSYNLKIDIIEIPKGIYLDTTLEPNDVTFNIASDPYSKAVPLYNKQTIPKFLENQMMKLYQRAEESIEYGIKKGKEGYVRPLADIKVKNNLLKYTELWQRLSSDTPIKSFCVARALQLLNVSGLSRVAPKSITPFIFNTKFPLIANKSLPSPGSSIVLTPAIKSLKTLYVTPSSNILTISQSEKDSKDANLGDLIRAFNSSGKSFEDIFELSGTLSQSEYTDTRTISAVRAAAIKLFQTQFEHSKKVERLLKKIFIIDNTITLNPDILDKGIRGIEDIAKEARELLTDYYSNCQTNYMDGVRILQNPSAPPIVNRVNNVARSNNTQLNNNNNNTKLNNNNNNNV